MHPNKRPIVVGGGAAGLIACLALEEAGHSPLLLEAGSELGGRLKTEHMSDGTPVDVGFQVLLTAYPELQRWVDFDQLDAVRFVPGAKVFQRGRWRTLADPRRRPQWLWRTLTSGIGTPADYLRLVSILNQSFRKNPLSVQDLKLKGSTQSFLHSKKLSKAFIDGFFAPFFSGIFLNRSLDPPPAQFLFTLRMFASGDVIRPKAGMRALVEQLSDRLRKTEIHLNTPVASTSAGAVTTTTGETFEGDGVIVTVPGVHPSLSCSHWYDCLNLVFECPQPPFGHPIIGLIPEAQTVTNLHFMADVQGAEGNGKLNVTAVRATNQLSLDDWTQAIREDLERAGLTPNRVLWSKHIRKALPMFSDVRSALHDSRLSDNTYAAGDFTAAPSLDAAMRSGRVAAEAWLSDRA